MEQVEQVFFNVPLSKLEPIFKRWMMEVITESIRGINKPGFEKFLTIEEASILLNYSVDTVLRKVSKKEIPVIKKGKRLYFLHSELVQYINS
jgi:excisionase family DNA binding protein